MTGSGSAAGPTELGDLRIELRSVNGRGMSVRFRLCVECAGLEPHLEPALRRRIARGSITLGIERQDAGMGVLGDLPALERVAERLRAVARHLGLPEEIGLRDLVALAGTLPRSVPAAGDGLPPQLAGVLAQALDRLVEARHTEGRTAVAAMLQQLDELHRLQDEAARRAPALVAEHRERMLQRVNQHLAELGQQLEPRDVVREVALLADRIDVAEELQRLGAHLGAIRTALAAGGEVGRRLEFLLQEVLREANTLGSKSPDVAIAHLVVAMKSCIDRLKEQAANLE